MGPKKKVPSTLKTVYALDMHCYYLRLHFLLLNFVCNHS